MPLLNVEIVGENAKLGLARLLADAAAKVLGAKPGATWVKVHYLPREQYAENADIPATVKPVFVSVLLAQHYQPTEYAKIAFDLSMAYAAILVRPQEHIHILFEPSAQGRIAFGGKLLTDIPLPK